MKIRTWPLLIVALALLSWTAPAWAQDQVDPKTLIGTYVWQPGRQWKALIEITDVSSDGVATGAYQHPNGKDPFKRKLIGDDGSAKLQLGQQIKMDLEYDKKNDAWVGPVTGFGPRAGADFNKAYFRRMK